MYNLATPAGVQAFEKDFAERDSLEILSAEAYFAKGKYGLCFNSCPVLVVDGDWDTTTFIAVYKGMLLRKWHGCYRPIDFKTSFYETLKDSPIAVVLPKTKRTKKNKNYKFIVLNNADGDDEQGNFNNMPSASFQCLGRLVNTTVHVVAKRLHTGSLKVVDYTDDERKKLTKKEKNAIDHVAALKPPCGFTLLYGEWHRSATVLIYDTKKKKSYLLGQDENTYFGVELVDNPKTIDAAYISLTPKDARGVPSVRQGEWFLIPVKANEAPDNVESAVRFNIGSTNSFVTLPITDPESNEHLLYADEVRIAQDGTIFALNAELSHNQNAELSHNQHDIVKMENWSKIRRNTAVQSVSQEGVD